MIVEEIIENNRVKHYSSDGKTIQQKNSGLLFIIAEDVYPCPFEYIEYEGNIPEFVDLEEKAEILNIILGDNV